MSTLIPTHLRGWASADDQPADRCRSFRLRSSAGGTWFTVEFYGDLLDEDGLIVDVEGVPALVMATAVDTGERLVIFDGGRHGYWPMFAEIHDADVLNSRTVDKPYRADTGADRFEIRIEVQDRIDWDIEADRFRDDDGVVRQRNGEGVDDTRLRADGFAALAVTVTCAEGVDRLIVAEGDLE